MTGGTSDLNRPIFDFLEPLGPDEMAVDDPLFVELVATPAFQRLKEIRFLGGIDYLLVRSPNGAPGNVRYTRYQHSIGVARLALFYCDIRKLPSMDRRTVYVAALLHDIGHAPLSHSLEPVFLEEFGLEHHKATEDIVKGKVPIGLQLSKILTSAGLDIDKIVNIIAGKFDSFDGFFTGPINFDTVEGILRTQKNAIPSRRVPSPEAVVEAAIRRSSEKDRVVVDKFWTYKDSVYRHIINSRQGVLADYACQIIMRQNLSKFSAADYFSTETLVFRKLPGLRELFNSNEFETSIKKYVDHTLEYKSRRFFVDPAGDFFKREDDKRYKQIKIDSVLRPRNLNHSDPFEMRRDISREK